MKRIITALLFAVLLAAATASAAFAHPPKDITCSWDAASSTLHVTANHVVDDPAKHFVLTMAVLQGQNKLAFKQYDKQGAPDKFSDSVVLKGVKSGATVKVTLLCNIMGTAETEYKLP